MIFNGLRECFFLSAMLFVVNCLGAQEQIVIILAQLPEYTPQTDTLYLTGTFNEWKLADENYRFRKLPDGTYRLAVNLEEQEDFEFKINRGDWESVEGNDVGGYLPNHKFAYSDSIFEYEYYVQSWQDLHEEYFPSITIKVLSIPQNTPIGSKIYVCGTFNGWNNKDPEYELKKGADGTYTTTIQAGLESFEYKFTRGSWKTVEGRWDGGAMSNREYQTGSVDSNVIKVNINSWEDMAKGRIGWKIIFLVLFIQGIMAIYFVYLRKAGKGMLFLLIILECAFIMRFLYNGSATFNIIPQGRLVPSVLIAFFVPSIYFWAKQKYLKKTSLLQLENIFPFLPVLLLVYFWTIPRESFREMAVSNEIDIYFFSLYFYALALNLYYLYKSNQIINNARVRVSLFVRRLFRAVQLINYINFALLVMSLLSLFMTVDIKLVGDWVENMIWISSGGLLIYAQVLFLKDNELVTTYKKSKTSKETSTEKYFSELKGRLLNLMEKKAIYTNPHLTLNEIAMQLGTNTYYVSKLINENFNMSYTDFVNRYRINAIIEEISNSKESDKTFLFYAHKMGFNSKSSFNRAFKKVTNQTPSEYFSYKYS